MEDKILTVPIHLKMTLTAREAAEYSNIGINKIDSMLSCLLYTSPSPRDTTISRMPSSA